MPIRRRIPSTDTVLPAKQNCRLSVKGTTQKVFFRWGCLAASSYLANSPVVRGLGADMLIKEDSGLFCGNFDSSLCILCTNRNYLNLPIQTVQCDQPVTDTMAK